MSSGLQWGSHRVSHHFWTPAAGAAAPVGASHGHCPQWRGPGWSRVGSLKLNLESHLRTCGSCVECLQVPHDGFGPLAVELDMGCEGRAGLKALSRVNVTATVVEGPTMGMPMVCSIFLPSQKDVGRCSCFLPKQHSSQLIFSISFFPHPIFHSGLAGHIRIPAKYLLNQDSDLCSAFSVRTHLLTVNFCVDSGTCFFNLLRIAVSFSDVFATIALWL